MGGLFFEADARMISTGRHIYVPQGFFYNALNALYMADKKKNSNLFSNTPHFGHQNNARLRKVTARITSCIFISTASTKFSSLKLPNPAAEELRPFENLLKKMKMV